MSSDERRMRELRERLDRVEEERDRLRDQLHRVRTSKAWRVISAYRDLRHRLSGAADDDLSFGDGAQDEDQRDRASASPVSEGDASPTNEHPVPAERLVRTDDRAAMARFRSRIDAWAERARGAPGDDVVVMFSGTTFVQEHRGNRPIRLTNVYLDQQSPVFFSYYRWKPSDPLPEHDHPLLFQSPIDVTPKVLPEVFGRDFGNRRKVFFVSFPHIDAIRLMSMAKGHGWTTVYDIRDDWEAFHEVGAAEWFDPTLERWTVQTADVVTAVSEPLADKLRIDAGRSDIHLSANALDSSFPSRPGRPGPDERVVGYFGHLTGQWFDWQLIRDAATALPAWTFELAGHGAPADLDLPDNVHVLGPLSHAELAERSSRWAGGMIPFKNGPIVDPLDPIKVYEYIHLGLPTVAGHFPPIADYPGVEICESTRDFVAAIERLPDRTVDDHEARRFLEGNRWTDRVDHYRRLVDDHRDGGPRSALDQLLRPGAGS